MTDDQDHTGMRRLLAGLKESGPMPDDLSKRIRASLAQEQVARGDGEETAFWDEMDEGGAPRREKRPVGRWVLGLAAAAVVVAGVGGVLAAQGDDGSSPTGSAAAESGTPESSGGEASAGTSAGSSADSSTPSQVPAFVVTDSGHEYTRENLPEKAAELVADPLGVPDLEDLGTVGAMSTAAGVEDCLGRLGHRELQPVVVDVAHFDGTPGLLIIAEPVPDGTARAWAVTTGCEEIWPGPITLPED